MNRFRLIIAAAFLMVFAVGCATPTYYNPRYPILPEPDRPVLTDVSAEEMQKLSPEAQVAIADNFNGLIDYSKKLEIAVRDYNNYAREENQLLDHIGLDEKRQKARERELEKQAKRDAKRDVRDESKERREAEEKAEEEADELEEAADDAEDAAKKAAREAGED